MSTVSTSNTPNVNAWLFCQDISANVTSPMAQQFVQMGTGLMQTAQSANDIDTAVNSFFQSTQDYQNVTLDNYVLVNSYLYTYANAWANFSSSYTYYLYAEPAAGGISLTPAGKVVFTRQALQGGSVPVMDGQSNTNANGNYAIAYHRDDNDTTGIPLCFSFAMLVSSLTDAVPAICFQCTYYPLFKLTLSNDDIGTIVPILFGNVNGQKLLGVNLQQNGNQIAVKAINLENQGEDQDGNADSSVWSWWAIMLTVVGCVVGIGLLFGGIYKLRARARKGEDLLDAINRLEEQEAANKGNPDGGKIEDEVKSQLEDSRMDPQVREDYINKILKNREREPRQWDGDESSSSDSSLFHNSENPEIQIEAALRRKAAFEALCGQASQDEAQQMENRMAGSGEVSMISSAEQLSKSQQDIEAEFKARDNLLIIQSEEAEIIFEESQILKVSQYGVTPELQEQYDKLSNLLNQLEETNIKSSDALQLLKQDQKKIDSGEKEVINEGQQVGVTLSKQGQQKVEQDEQFEKEIDTEVKQDEAKVKENNNDNEYEE